MEFTEAFLGLVLDEENLDWFDPRWEGLKPDHVQYLLGWWGKAKLGSNAAVHNYGKIFHKALELNELRMKVTGGGEKVSTP